MYNSKIAYKNDGLITERDLLDEGLTLTSWDPLGCFNSYIYSPIEGIDICRSLLYISKQQRNRLRQIMKLLTPLISLKLYGY